MRDTSRLTNPYPPRMLKCRFSDGAVGRSQTPFSDALADISDDCGYAPPQRRAARNLDFGVWSLPFLFMCKRRRRRPPQSGGYQAPGRLLYCKNSAVST